MVRGCYPIPKLENHPFLPVHECLFNIFTVPTIGGGRLLQLQLEDMPCRSDKGPT
jgi:hypothetical protein